MARASRFSQEVRERSVRMVLEHGGEYGSQWEAICSIAEKIGCSAETLRKWVRQTGTDLEVSRRFSIGLAPRPEFAAFWIRVRVRLCQAPRCVVYNVLHGPLPSE